jgi:hypothetical protein
MGRKRLLRERTQKKKKTKNKKTLFVTIKYEEAPENMF